MLTAIKNFFKKEDKLPEVTVDSYTYLASSHRGWGNSITLESHESKDHPGMYRMAAHGHLSRKPRNGDLIVSKMVSGKTSKLLVYNVRYPGDPSDVWFCDLTIYQEETS